MERLLAARSIKRWNAEGDRKWRNRFEHVEASPLDQLLDFRSCV